MVITEIRNEALIKEFGEYEVQGHKYYYLTVIDTDNGEYAIGTEDEADNAWELSLDDYLEEFIYPELPENIVSYFDDEKWKRDARYDGRGHSLNSYDGDEINLLDMVIFRIS